MHCLLKKYLLLVIADAYVQPFAYCDSKTNSTSLSKSSVKKYLHTTQISRLFRVICNRYLFVLKHILCKRWFLLRFNGTFRPINHERFQVCLYCWEITASESEWRRYINYSVESITLVSLKARCLYARRCVSGWRQLAIELLFTKSEKYRTQKSKGFTSREKKYIPREGSDARY